MNLGDGQRKKILRSATSRMLYLPGRHSYFDPDKETVIYTDGTPIGLGAVLTQKGVDGNPVPLHYASYPFTATESRYPQIDREVLAIYWAVKRFHLYLYGKDFKIVTDHQPHVSLFNNQSR
jgi:hypothetical protein